MSEDASYEVMESERGYEVMSPGGYCKIVCRTRSDAEQYRVLLDEAFQAGYKSGYRAAKGGA